MSKIQLKKILLTILSLLLFYSCEAEDNPMESTCQSHTSCSDSFSFMLTDLNTTSPTHCSAVGPETWDGEIRLFYFSSNEQ